jgi:hypothetical protein
VASGLTGGINYVLVSILSSMIIVFFPAKDERNLAYGYAIIILLSVIVMSVILRINKVQSKDVVRAGLV